MNFGYTLLVAVYWLLNLYALIILASALISWFFLPPSNTIVRLLRFLTEPVLAPCRKLLERLLPYQWRRFDFSPVLALAMVQFVRYIIEKVLQYMIITMQ